MINPGLRHAQYPHFLQTLLLRLRFFLAYFLLQKTHSHRPFLSHLTNRALFTFSANGSEFRTVSPGGVSRRIYFRYLSINSIGDAAIQRFRVRQQPFIKPTSDLAPKITGPFCRFLSLLKQLTTCRLSLINQEGQHHDIGKHRGQVLLAMTKIMLEMIALVLQVLKVSFSTFQRARPARIIISAFLSVIFLSVTQEKRRLSPLASVSQHSRKLTFQS